MSYFINSHPAQECGECYGCPASSYHRGKCADRLYEQEDREREAFENHMIETQMFEEHMEKESENLTLSQTKIEKEEE